MQVIVSHVNTDFDALASMIAAKKLYPDAEVVLSDRQDPLVTRFLNIYRDTLPLKQANDIDWEEVTEVILVDVASLKRTGSIANRIRDDVRTIVYDHHPKKHGDVTPDAGIVELVGATVTLLIEEIKQRSLAITPFEATLFGLGIYTDTGSFTFKTTTERDFLAAQFLLQNGMSLEMVKQFSEQTLEKEQHDLLDELFNSTETIEYEGLELAIATAYREQTINGLATVTRKLFELKDVDAMLTVVGMKRHVFIVGRARSNRISLQPLLKKFGGGGHKHAGSATVKRADYKEIYEQVKEHMHMMIKRATTAQELMASPVKTITPDTTIAEAGEKMYRYGHSGYPVVDDDKLVGIITRRDLDKANHHGLGHAPVKAYMSTNIITITPDTPLEEVQQTIIAHNIGRLPVVENDQLIGIISRTDIIQALHEQVALTDHNDEDTSNEETNVDDLLQEQLDERIYHLLKDIGAVAKREHVSVYLIGGIVRDLLLQRPNDDIDIVVEGDGISFARALQATYGGKLTVHEQFGTATWQSEDEIEVDIATSRLEYYDEPAALPDVESSTLREDLHRRDFTINAMAVYLNEDRFGDIVDPFSGQDDLFKRTIRVLHNISFVEDPTRILRAVRFELRFQFQMDEQTESLAKQSISQMESVSNDRIIAELERLFEEVNAEDVIDRLFTLSFWEQFSIENTYRKQSCEHARRLQQIWRENNALFTLNERDSWVLYFLMPFYYANKLSVVESFLRKRRTKKLLAEIKELKTTSLLEKRLDEKDLHKGYKQYTNESLLFVATTTDVEETNILTYVKKRHQLAVYVTGSDLKEKGIQPGPIYSDIFLQLEQAMLANEVTNKKEAEQWLERFVRQKEETE